jgi:hypothetical protein
VILTKNIGRVPFYKLLSGFHASVLDSEPFIPFVLVKFAP